MRKYDVLSKEISEQIENSKKSGIYTDVSFDDKNIVRRRNISKDNATVWRPPFVHDIDKILHCPYYNRYTDKTQVFSLYKNDDITRRSLHVQLVSRISRTIGAALHLNLDLIEAIALGHDMGHPPFAHTGEVYLNEIYHAHTGKYFAHNLQSVRVLDTIFPYNISLQTLEGIASHNGEIECEEFHPVPIKSFEEFDKLMEKCHEDQEANISLMPSTLEAAVVRLSDIISYLGKDRQDAMRANLTEESVFFNEDIGSINAEIINNLVVNVIENSYGKPYIKLDSKHFKALQKSKIDNYRMIYNYAASIAKLDKTVRPMMNEIYGQLLEDFKNNKLSSPIFTHHINYVNSTHYKRIRPYEDSEPNRIVADYIASMTDNYFVDLYSYMFPNSDLSVQYKGYFDE
jgi:dGTPase